MNFGKLEGWSGQSSGVNNIRNVGGDFFFIFALFLDQSFFYNTLMALLGFLLYIVVARNANEGTQLGEL